MHVHTHTHTHTQQGPSLNDVRAHALESLRYSYSCSGSSVSLMMERKVRIHWLSDEGIVQKVWRYNDETIQSYTRDQVEEELTELFPVIKSKHLRFEMCYEDSFVGKVKIDSDKDVQTALKAFAEEENVTFRTLFVTECIKPESEVEYSRIEAPRIKKRKVIFILVSYLISVYR